MRWSLDFLTSREAAPGSSLAGPCLQEALATGCAPLTSSVPTPALGGAFINQLHFMEGDTEAQIVALPCQVPGRAGSIVKGRCLAPCLKVTVRKGTGTDSSPACQAWPAVRFLPALCRGGVGWGCCRRGTLSQGMLCQSAHTHGPAPRSARFCTWAPKSLSEPVLCTQPLPASLVPPREAGVGARAGTQLPKAGVCSLPAAQQVWQASL